MVFTIVISILLFLSLVLIHEWGHFIIAKKSGIKVNEFAIGMGPSIYKKQKGETLYRINIFPIGGYCAMEGEEEGSDDPRSFNNASPVKRLFTVLAGPFMNIVLAIVIYSIVVFNTGVASPTIGNIMDNSPAAKSGLEVGDTFLAIDNQNIDEFSDISEILAKHKQGDSLTVTVLRDDEKINFDINPVEEDGRLVFGVESAPRKVGFFEAIKIGFIQAFTMLLMIIKILGALFTGKIGLSSLSGPVGVVKELGNQAQVGFLNLLNFFAYISLNLGFFNLIPIPALDGSKILSSLYEIITKKKVNKKLSTIATQVGFVFLLALIFIVSIKDIMNLF